MNELTQFLVDSILNEDKVPGTTAIWGWFKPPTEAILKLLAEV